MKKLNTHLKHIIYRKIVFSGECGTAVDVFEEEMLAKMAEISTATDLTVAQAATIFDDSLESGTQEIYTLIDDMVDGVMLRIADILVEMETKLSDQYAELDAAIIAADAEIETSLNEGLALLEAEFNDADNIDAIAALKALAVQDFASLKLDQIYYPPHHHHVHGPGEVHDPLLHPLHEHQPYHASYGPHHIHLNEPHHLFDDSHPAYAHFSNLDESLGQDWPEDQWPVWNGTTWTFDHISDEHTGGHPHPHPSFNHGDHANITDPYHPHKHDAGFPDHGPHPLSPHTPPHHHHDHGDGDNDQYLHEHLPDHDEEAFHTHVDSSHFPHDSPFGEHHALHNFHPHGHGIFGMHNPNEAVPHEQDFDHHTPHLQLPSQAGGGGPTHIDGEDGVYDFHEHPPAVEKVLIAKIEFTVASPEEWNPWIGDFTTTHYVAAAESYATLFDEEFESVADDFQMTMTGLYVKFTNATETADSDRKRRSTDLTDVTIVVYFERVLAREAPVAKAWYESWLALKISQHAFAVISASDGSLTSIAAAPETTVDLWVKFIPAGEPESHYGYNPGTHVHQENPVPARYEPYYTYISGQQSGPDYWPRTTTTLQERPDWFKCKKEREIAELSQDIHAYVPQCDSMGKYTPEQCWSATGYCWCVDRFGTMVPGTERKGWGQCEDHQLGCTQKLWRYIY